MANFYLIRHGDTDWIEGEKYSFKGNGRDLVGLTTKGIQEVKQCAQKLKGLEIQLIVSSPYTRAMHTAAILSSILQVEIQVEIDLREWQPDLTYQYTSYKEYEEATKQYYLYGGIVPNNNNIIWETREALEKRIDGVLFKYKDYKCIVFITHEKVIELKTHNKYNANCSINYIKYTKA